MQRLPVVMLILLSYHLILAQEKVANDSSAITARNFVPAAINKYKSDPAFKYERIVEPPRSLWHRFWEWFWQKVAEIIGSEEGGRAVNIILILLATGILVFFIFKLTGMSNAGLFGKKNAGNKLDYSIHDENIHEIDFESAISEAIENKKFRFAVRLLYLQSLKHLTDRRLINWQLNKTNVTYVQELKGNSYQQSFRDLTFQFENNWYGDIPIEENEFHQVRNLFIQFNRQLN